MFNGELDRIRGGYYPAFAFGELAKLGREFIPKVAAARARVLGGGAGSGARA